MGLHVLRIAYLLFLPTLVDYDAASAYRYGRICIIGSTRLSR